MLAGLIIATHEAADRPDMLTATLPFGGVTLIEYQARLLIGAGASQIVVMVGRLTPELLGAISRIARRGITTDTVRSATEATERLHPLSRVVMMADGLTTTPDVVAAMAREGGDALLVVDEEPGDGAFERVGGGMAWAGIARLDPRRIAELAELPRDYDLQSTLVRLAAQAHATHVRLPQGAQAHGHGIDHRGDMLVQRGRSVLANAVTTGPTWFERFVVSPLARMLVPLAIPRTIPVLAIAMLAGLVALGGVIALWFGALAWGMSAVLVATITCALAAKLAMLRDETKAETGLIRLTLALPAVTLLIEGHAATLAQANGAPQLLAVAGVVAGGLVERAATGVERPWWASTPPACLAVATMGAIAGVPVVGLALATLMATVTLGWLIELLRREA